MLYMSCMGGPDLGVKHFLGGSGLLGVVGQTVNNIEFHNTIKIKTFIYNFYFMFY